jgi:hypothetical protein
MSSVEYGVHIWGGATNIQFERLQKVIDNFLKKWNLPFSSRVEDLYEKFNILRVDEYVKMAMINLGRKYQRFSGTKDMQRIYYDAFPNLMKNFVQTKETEHETRNKFDFDVPVHVTTLFVSSPQYRLVKIWNDLPNKIKKIEFCIDFKFEATQYLIKKYRN